MIRTDNPWREQFLNEAWAEHIYLSTGKRIKPFKDRCSFGSYTLANGFKKEKPIMFKVIDSKLLDKLGFEHLIQLADNRMMMGDVRYGSVVRADLSNYNPLKEYYVREKEAYRTKNLEYVLDAYNMYRIAAFMKQEFFLGKEYFRLKHLIEQAIWADWKLVPVDDGIHATEGGD